MYQPLPQLTTRKFTESKFTLLTPYTFLLHPPFLCPHSVYTQTICDTEAIRQDTHVLLEGIRTQLGKVMRMATKEYVFRTESLLCCKQCTWSVLIAPAF